VPLTDFTGFDRRPILVAIVLRTEISRPRRLRYAQDTADASNRPALDLVVPGHGRLGQVRGIHPNIVFGAVMVQDTALLAQVLFELPAIHEAVSSKFLGRGRTQSAHQPRP
jgi:hypothetical protein